LSRTRAGSTGRTTERKAHIDAPTGSNRWDRFLLGAFLNEENGLKKALLAAICLFMLSAYGQQLKMDDRMSNYLYDKGHVRYELYQSNGGKPYNWLFFPGGPGADSNYLAQNTIVFAPFLSSQSTKDFIVKISGYCPLKMPDIVLGLKILRLCVRRLMSFA
jgi:hypothetical protein